MFRSSKFCSLIIGALLLAANFVSTSNAQGALTQGWPGQLPNTPNNWVVELYTSPVTACQSIVGNYVPNFGFVVDNLVDNYDSQDVTFEDGTTKPSWICRYTQNGSSIIHTILLIYGCRDGVPGYLMNEGTCLPDKYAIAPEFCPDCTQPIVGGPPGPTGPSIASGAYYSETVDYSGTNNRPFVIARTYRSHSMPLNGNGIGLSWRTHLTRTLEVSGLDSATVTREDGVRERFIQFSSNQATARSLERHYIPGNGVWAGWSYRGERGSFERITTDVYEYIDENDRVDRFEIIAGEHRVIQTRWPGGYHRDYVYSGGQLTQINDNLGKSLNITWAGGVIDTIIMPGGVKIDYDYQTHSTGGVNSTKKVLSSVKRYAANGTQIDSMSYEYLSTGYVPLLTGVFDRHGNRVETTSYDNFGRVTSIEQADGVGQTTIAYQDSSFGAPADTRTVTGPLGQVTTYTVASLAQEGFPFNRPFQVTQVDRQNSATVPAGSNTKGYTEGLWTEAVNWNGVRRTLQYNLADQVIQEVQDADGEGRNITYTWHDDPNKSYRLDFNKPTQIVTPACTVDYTYGSTGEMLSRSVTVEVGKNKVETSTWNYTWTPTGLISSIDEPRTDVSDVTTFGYDPSGNLTTITNPLGHVTTFGGHDARGLPASATDENGVALTFTYDDLGRLLTSNVQGATVATTTYVYDIEGLLSSIQLPNGVTTAFEYDDAYRLTAMVNGLGERVEFTLDAMGNPTGTVAKSAAALVTWSNSSVFDSLGRMIANITLLGQTDVAYDPMGNPLQLIDPRSAATQNIVDAFHRVTQVTDALNGVVQFTYDQGDNLTSVTDQNGNTTTYDVNGFGEITKIDSPDRGVILFDYDEAGNLIYRKDARKIETDFTYDALNRLTGKVYRNKNKILGSVNFSYDDTANGNHGVGRLTSLSDFSGSSSFVYDHLDRLVEESRVQDGVTQTVSYAYDLAGNLTQIVYPSGRIVDYSLDALGRPSAVSFKANAAATAQTVANNITYLPFGPVSSLTLGNGVQVTYTYDLDYRLTRIQAQAPGGAMLQDLSFSYDGSGNIDGITDAVDPGRDQTLAYDLLNRLTQAIGPWGDDSYTYDPVGNRLSRSIVNGGNTETTNYSYLAGTNKLEEVVTAALTRQMDYDAGGRLVEDKQGTKKNDPATDYGYDAAGRMDSVVHHAGASATYTYDAFGRKRTIVEAGGPTTRQFYLGGGGTLLEESDGAGAVQRSYLRVAGMPLGAVTAAGDLQWVLSDQIGQAQKLLDASAAVIWDRIATPFGETHAVITGLEGDEPTRFPGQRFEQLTGLHYNFHRHYDPSLGRYIQADPIGLDGGLNLYAYAGNNPVTNIDPEGLIMGGPCYYLDHDSQISDPSCEVTPGFGGGGGMGRGGGKSGSSGSRSTSKGQNCDNCAGRSNGASKTGGDTDSPPEGVVYKRTDPETGACYIGQCISPKRFEARKKEHDRDKGVEHDYEIIGRAKPGNDLDVLEESAIRSHGGLKRKGGKLENKRHQMNDKRYRDGGGTVPKPEYGDNLNGPH